MTNRTKLRPLAALPLVLVLAVAVHATVIGCGGGSTNNQAATDAPAAPEPPATPNASNTAATGDLAEGKAVYVQRCALCHGQTGKGDGPGAKGLKPAPANHTDATYMSSKSDEELLNVIRNGKGAMPAWGKVLTEEQIQAVFKYVRSLHGAA